jgi:hypothetical protein
LGQTSHGEHIKKPKPTPPQRPHKPRDSHETSIHELQHHNQYVPISIIDGDNHSTDGAETASSYSEYSTNSNNDNNSTKPRRPSQELPSSALSTSDDSTLTPQSTV